jgi:hypothetical protein
VWTWLEVQPEAITAKALPTTQPTLVIERFLAFIMFCSQSDFTVCACDGSPGASFVFLSSFSAKNIE